jgi:hypothetical protein
VRPPRQCSRPLRAAALGILLASACSAPPKPAPPPPLRVELDHFAGTVLTGPTAEEAGDEQEVAALGLSLRVALLPSAPPGELLPVRLVVAEGLPEPFRTQSELARGARRLPRFDQPIALWDTLLQTALLAGATSVLALEPEGTLPDAPRPAWERLEVEVSRRRSDPAQLEVALELRGLVPLEVELEPEDLDEGPAREVGRASVLLVQTRERVVLEGAPRPGEPAWRLVFPAPTATAPDAVVLVELATASAAGPEAVAAARERVAASRQAAAARAAGLSGAENFRIESASALDALSRRELGRPALLYLAGETDAELVAELALVADVEALGDLLAAARARLAALDEPALEPRALGWVLESSAWLWLAERAQSDDPHSALPPELTALVLRKAGEAGRWPDLLVDAVAESGSVAALRERIERENRIFLEDADPAARVRAFDWLAARGRQPEGYDPLASSEERRAALARLEQLEEAAEDGR